METIVLSVFISHQEFLAAPLNDKGQLIKGLVLWEMYPSSHLLNQSQPYMKKKEFHKDAAVHTS